MGVVELLLTGLGLAMDAFVASICKGLAMRRIRWAQAFVIAFCFGAFQALMPLLGWAVGSMFAGAIESVDHWVAFGLLAFLGGKMLWDAFHEDGEEDEAADYERLNPTELLMLSVATSIDALAVGITFAFLGVNIWLAIAIIGAVTFVMSLAGVMVGHRFGSRYEKPATIVGGLVLIGIGVKILIEHLLG